LNKETGKKHSKKAYLPVFSYKPARQVCPWQLAQGLCKVYRIY